ncbi:hypothetical protein [Burkholderia sp. MSMB1835]|uniref:hypothetical protein n=1 Tax=Burkholderia sp. MSMB1835 TaxID=1637876 RepID=UPI0007526F99|nr:hypothetical protein [Burkholderia sp. MSMB1835]KVL25044.1 hypothetical protein WS96_29745 [Burkholderia sp. MSMB1835]
MTSVMLDLGSGKRATLTRATSSIGASQSMGQRSAVSELMLHWPKYAGLTANALTYIRRLGLDVLQGTPLDALKSAIEIGRVAVEIDRGLCGGGGGSQPSIPPFPRASRLASVPGMTSLPTDKPLPSWATPSDVSGDALLGYLESIIGGCGAGGTAGFTGVASSLLEDAQPFDYAAGTIGDSVESLAAATNNPNFAAKMLGYDRKTFGQMLHILKPANGLGPADNVIFHDSGDVEFKGVIIDNIHDYAR